MYLGNIPATSFETVRKQISTSNSGTTITLDVAVSSVQDILVTVDAVIQSYDNYSVSGNTLQLNGTLNNNRVEILYVGRTFQTVSPSDGSVTRDKLNLVSDGSNPSLIAKGTSGVSEGYIQLNCAENSHGVKIKSPPHSAGQSYTLTLPQSITNNTFLKTDSSGNLSFASAGITEADMYRLTANLSVTGNSSVDITTNLERVDTTNFSKIGTGISESSGIFTFPSTGIYQVTAIGAFYGGLDTQFFSVRIFTTPDNSTYTMATATNSHTFNGYYAISTNEIFFDVTNTTTHKVKFQLRHHNAGALLGNTSYNLSFFKFIRLGDT